MLDFQQSGGQILHFVQQFAKKYLTEKRCDCAPGMSLPKECGPMAEWPLLVLPLIPPKDTDWLVLAVIV